MSKPKETLLHSLAHDLRQPLSTIESIAYYLQIALPNLEPRVEEQLKRLRELVEQSGSMLTDALTLEAGAETTPEVIDINELVTEFALDAAQHEPSRPQFDIRLDGACVWMDYGHARHLVQSVCRLLRSLSRQNARILVETRMLSCGSVLLRASAEPRPSEGLVLPSGYTLTLNCLEHIAAANQGTLYFNLSNQAPLELAVELPAAPKSARPTRSVPEADAAFEEDETPAPVAQGTL
jgi:hypothetical protein